VCRALSPVYLSSDERKSLDRAGLLSFDQDVRLPELARRALRRSGKLHATAISTCALCRQRCESPVRRQARNPYTRAILGILLNCAVRAAAHEEAGSNERMCIEIRVRRRCLAQKTKPGRFVPFISLIDHLQCHRIPQIHLERFVGDCHCTATSPPRESRSRQR
jgi:hypothetical protein